MHWPISVNTTWLLLLFTRNVDNSLTGLLSSCHNPTFKKITLKALTLAHKLSNFQACQQTIGQSGSFPSYKAYTTKFDKTLRLNNFRPNTAYAYALYGAIESVNRKRLCCALYWVPLAIQRLSTDPKWQPNKLRLIVDRSLSVSNKLNLILRIIRLTASLAQAIEVVGYTTRHWMGGNSFKVWNKSKSPYPGRVNDILYIEYSDEPFHFSVFERTNSNPLKENVDGEAVLKLCDPNKINILVCDNNPADYTTSKLNHGDILDKHLNRVCFFLKKNHVKILKINIGCCQERAWINLNKYSSRYGWLNLLKSLLRLLWYGKERKVS